MILTEPDAGSDVGAGTTKATDMGDGTWHIEGVKRFITSGEHDVTENIIHLVLARPEGAGPGTKGLSLFLVPKFLVNEDGSLGERNGVACGSLEEKMGIHGNATCVMNYDSAKGWLVGAEHKGMRAMFTMMNAARLGVGVQGLSQSVVAYQNAVTYANERIQGRSLTGTKEADKAADPIIVHPDVRRMLMMQRAFNEGARALAMWVGLHIDIAHKHPDERTRRDADDLAALLTPVVKAYFTDAGFENAVQAMQCYGGHGYIQEWGMEQFVRDARITQIYEGANGIQALDLVGRKLPQNMGRLLRQFFHPVDAFIQEHMADANLGKDFVVPLARAFARLQTATQHVALEGMKNPDEAGAASSDYLRLFGLVALGYMWAQMAKLAQQRLAEGTDDAAFYENKIKTGRFFMQRMLPDTSALLDKATAGAETLMALDAEAF